MVERSEQSLFAPLQMCFYYLFVSNIMCNRIHCFRCSQQFEILFSQTSTTKKCISIKKMGTLPSGFEFEICCSHHRLDERYMDIYIWPMPISRMFLPHSEWDSFLLLVYSNRLPYGNHKSNKYENRKKTNSIFVFLFSHFNERFRIFCYKCKCRKFRLGTCISSEIVNWLIEQQSTIQKYQNKNQSNSSLWGTTKVLNHKSI